MNTARPTPIRSLPIVRAADAPAPSSTSDIQPIVGGCGVAVEYKDAEGTVRMRFMFDETVPFDDVLWWRKQMTRMGDSLPPRRAPRIPLLGPRLLPGLVAFGGLDLLLSGLASLGSFGGNLPL